MILFFPTRKLMLKISQYYSVDFMMYHGTTNPNTNFLCHSLYHLGICLSFGAQNIVTLAYIIVLEHWIRIEK